MFENREEAGEKLASKLLKYKGKKCIIFAIPRGGVVVAFEVAKFLKAPLDLVIPRKLGAPHNPELAVGAVAPDGSTVLDEKLIRELHVSEEYIEQVKNLELSEIQRRMKKYRGNTKYPNLKNYIAIIIDDGIATGATVLASVKFLREQNASKIVIAVPVMPEEIIDKIKREADELIYLEAHSPFNAVGLFYKNFPQTSDEEVIDLLNKAKKFFKK